MTDLTRLKEALELIERPLRLANNRFQRRCEDKTLQGQKDLTRWVDRDLRPGLYMPDLAREKARCSGDDARAGRKRKGKAVNDPTESDTVFDALEPENLNSKRLCNYDGTEPRNETYDIQTDTTLDRSGFAGCLRVAGKAVDILDHLNSPGFMEHLVSSSRSARDLQCSPLSLSLEGYAY